MDQQARRMLDTFTYHPLGEATRTRLSAAHLDSDSVAAFVRAALAEDLAGGIDVTSVATVSADHRCAGVFAARKPRRLAGLSVAAAVIETACGADRVTFDYLASDGQRIDPGTPIARVTAPTRTLLTAERTALNLLCHMSGVATLTARWAEVLAGTAARVRDTRKTLPGFRAFQKYAVRCGGGVNHRMSLCDAAVVKDNHVAAAGGVAAAFSAVRALDRAISVEIEVDSLDALREAILAGANEILLDNFDTPTLREAVAIRNSTARHVLLEASGGLTLEVAAEVAATGVDFIAVGELTHSPRAFDIGLDFESAVPTA